MTRESPGAASRRESIIEAARKVFAERGFDAGTTRQIAAEAGVAEGLIYHYFDSKEALLDAVVRGRSILPWLAQPDALPDGAPAEAALQAMAAEVLDRIGRHPDLFAVVWSQLGTNRALAGRVGGMVAQIVGRLAAYQDRRIAAGELRPIDTYVAARTFVASLVMFAIAESRLSPPLEPLSPEAYVRDLVDLILHGMDAWPAKGESHDEGG